MSFFSTRSQYNPTQSDFGVSLFEKKLIELSQTFCHNCRWMCELYMPSYAFTSAASCEVRVRVRDRSLSPACWISWRFLSTCGSSDTASVSAASCSACCSNSPKPSASIPLEAREKSETKRYQNKLDKVQSTRKKQQWNEKKIALTTFIKSLNVTFLACMLWFYQVAIF